MNIKDSVRIIARHKPDLLPILSGWAKDNINSLETELKYPIKDAYPTVVNTRSIYELSFYLELRYEIEQLQKKRRTTKLRTQLTDKAIDNIKEKDKPHSCT